MCMYCTCTFSRVFAHDITYVCEGALVLIDLSTRLIDSDERN